MPPWTHVPLFVAGYRGARRRTFCIRPLRRKTSRLAREKKNLISNKPQHVIPGPRSGTRNPENTRENLLDSGFCPGGQPWNDDFFGVTACWLTIIANQEKESRLCKKFRLLQGEIPQPGQGHDRAARCSRGPASNQSTRLGSVAHSRAGLRAAGVVSALAQSGRRDRACFASATLPGTPQCTRRSGRSRTRSSGVTSERSKTGYPATQSRSPTSSTGPVRRSCRGSWCPARTISSTAHCT